MRESFGYSTSAPATRPAAIEAGNISIIPGIRKTTMVPRRGRSRGSEQDFKMTKAAIEAYLMKAGAQGKVSVAITQRGLVVSLKEAGFFDSGSAGLKQSSYRLLDDVVSSLSSYSNAVRIEGHTDNVPMSSASYPSNWELSTARATHVLQYLAKQDDFEPSKMSATGYGEYRPVADNGSDEGRQQNRRVDIVLLSDQSERNEP
jgi:chemotaxis protein MotB